MSVLILKDTSIEVFTRDNYILSTVPRLVLEVISNGNLIDKANLISRKLGSGVWDADDILVLYDTVTQFVVSVSLGTDRNKRQLLGFIELKRPEIYERLGKSCEMPLICHEKCSDIIFKTRSLGVDELRRLLSDIPRLTASLQRTKTPQKIYEEGIAALSDYEHNGKPESLEHAITQFEHVRSMVVRDHPALPGISSNLGICLRDRFERFGDVADINNSIYQLEMAINLVPDSDPSKPGFLHNLGASLLIRFKRLSDATDLDNSIVSQQASVNLTPEGHPKKPSRLTDLGTSFLTRFERFGNLADLEDAIGSHQVAVNLTPGGHSDKPHCLNNLGISLRTRFARLGNLIDIDNAIKSQQIALDLTREGHPIKPSYFSSLGTSLLDRFKWLGDIADLHNAIKSHQMSVDLTPEGHPVKPRRLTCLGSSLEARYGRLGDVADITNSIESQQKALNLTPEGHPDKAGLFHNLGISLRNRFKRLGNFTDLDNAVESHQVAVKLTPDGHPNKPNYLTNLGYSLQIRFEQLGNLVDIDDAITAHQVAVNLPSDDHHHKSVELKLFAAALTLRFLRLRDSQDASAAISAISASVSAHSSPPIDRFNAAGLWSLIGSFTGHSSILDAYDHAIAIMPLVAWLGLPIVNRHQHLVEIGGITREAAAAAVSLEKYGKALEWLEQGRSIVWTQILQLRTPVDDLRDYKPELANRLVQISRVLDQGAERDELLGQGERSEEERRRQYRQLTMERESIINQIRSFPNFENFLRPLESFQLTKAAQDGSIVVLNIAEGRCDALALVPGSEDAIHIPLPNLTSVRVKELADELKNLLNSSGIRMRATERVEDEAHEVSCTHILAELWRNLVKPILDSLAFPSGSDTLPRIWWCVTGPLAFLPIHAAGIYDSQDTSEQLYNYAISSYIPSISTLLEPFRPPVKSTFKLLSVIQPSAPGASVIPNTKEELKCIRKRLSDRTHVVLEGAQGTKEQVMQEMKNCNWLHLACHGVQKVQEPTKSALILQDGYLTLEEIIRLDLPNAEFAFLSACQTTKGDENLSEEAVHIAGGMLLAGYRGVIATMWSIKDELAPEVADEFYAHLTRDGRRPDSRKAAEALHISIQKLRQKKEVPLAAWIPFVHLGV